MQDLRRREGLPFPYIIDGLSLPHSFEILVDRDRHIFAVYTAFFPLLSSPGDAHMATTTRRKTLLETVATAATKVRTWLLGADPASQKLYRETVLSDNLSKQTLKDHLDMIFERTFPNFHVRIYDVSKGLGHSLPAPFPTMWRLTPSSQTCETSTFSRFQNHFRR
jgi:hypothetical protein